MAWEEESNMFQMEGYDFLHSGHGLTRETPVEIQRSTGDTWALTLSETGALRWQAITQRCRWSFQQTPLPRSPSPRIIPLHTFKPYADICQHCYYSNYWLHTQLSQPNLPDRHQFTDVFQSILSIRIFILKQRLFWLLVFFCHIITFPCVADNWPDRDIDIVCWWISGQRVTEG